MNPRIPNDSSPKSLARDRASFCKLCSFLFMNPLFKVDPLSKGCSKAPQPTAKSVLGLLRREQGSILRPKGWLPTSNVRNFGVCYCGIGMLTFGSSPGSHPFSRVSLGDTQHVTN